MIKSQGYCLGNADITIILERPRVAPYIEQMQTTVADAIGVEKNQINIKATTEEGLGLTGNGAGISANAVVLLNVEFH